MFLIVLYYNCHTRYDVMKECWKLTPSERPTFTELVATLDKTLMSVAGYTELGMTLVEGGGEEEEGWGAEPAQPPHEADQGELLALCIIICVLLSVRKLCFICYGWNS